MNTVYKTQEEFNIAWHKMADGKLDADNINKLDLDAVRQSLEECVGGTRLFEAWLTVEAKAIRKAKEG